MVVLEMTEREAMCLHSNIDFAIGQLYDLSYATQGGWEAPEIGEDVETLKKIMARLPEPKNSGVVSST